MPNIQQQIDTVAQELARKYNEMKWSPDSRNEYSTSDFLIIQREAEKKFEEPNRTQMLERFRALVGLDGDSILAYKKLIRDFPGSS